MATTTSPPKASGTRPRLPGSRILRMWHFHASTTQRSSQPRPSSLWCMVRRHLPPLITEAMTITRGMGRKKTMLRVDSKGGQIMVVNLPLRPLGICHLKETSGDPRDTVNQSWKKWIGHVVSELDQPLQHRLPRLLWESLVSLGSLWRRRRLLVHRLQSLLQSITVSNCRI